ncbi:MAG: DNA repair protein RecN [Alistipes sp.]
MLRRLTVENYALIERLEMELDPHLNIITGETGAGKSILLGALGLLLGNKNDGVATKDATTNCVVEGVFQIQGVGLADFFANNDLDYQEEITIRRIITPSGKSRSFIGDLPVPLTTIKALGNQLIDIHSQHENLILSSENFRTEAIDALAKNSDLRHAYTLIYARLSALRSQLSNLQERTAAGHADEAWLRYQVEELVAAKLRTGEQSELEQEQTMLAHADHIGETLALLHTTLEEEETGVLLQLKRAEIELNHIRNDYPMAGEWADRLHSALLEIKDINDTSANLSDRIEANPERLQAVNNRLDNLYSLGQKHHTKTIEELITLRDQYTDRLQAITHSDEELALLQTTLTEAEAEAHKLAEQLHQARAQAVPAFENEVLSTLRELDMAETLFQINLEKSSALTPTGQDIVTFLFSPNRTATPRPVERIASGGELSRVMLAIKALLARQMQLPTVIFDEIDTGVSGRIADAMGVIIHTLSKTMQVVDITHLPQVASKGQTHFVVYKEDGRTQINCLTADDRVTEIAKMLSGSEITTAARTQAKILLGQ